MIEDKLSTEQRIRLEALNQAAHLSHVHDSKQTVLAKAKTFEQYIKTGVIEQGNETGAE